MASSDAARGKADMTWRTDKLMALLRRSTSQTNNCEIASDDFLVKTKGSKIPCILHLVRLGYSDQITPEIRNTRFSNWELARSAECAGWVSTDRFYQKAL